MKGNRYVFMDQAGADGAAGGGAAAAPGAAGGQGGANNAPNGQASTVPNGGNGSLGGSVLAAGAAASAGAPGGVVAKPEAGAPGTGTGTPQPGAAASPIPEKYQVKKADGSIDVDASLAKFSEGYSHLAKKLGGGDLPPATPADYKPQLPAGFDGEALTSDPMWKSFLEGAHAKGMTNDQLSWALNEWSQRQAMLTPTPEKAFGELQKVWKTEADFNANARNASKALAEFGDDLSEADRQAIDSNPVALRLLAKIGAQLREDVAPIMPGTPAAESWDQQIAAIKAHPGFTDKSHPEHASLIAKQTALYNRRYGKQGIKAKTFTA